MKKQKMGSLITGVLLLLITISGWAQEGPNGYNPNSVRGSKKSKQIFGKPIYEADVMYRTTVWRKINLKEKQNRSFFSIDNEITRVIIDGVRAKKLQPYQYQANPTNDGVSSPMQYEDFLKKLSYYDEDVQDTVLYRASDFYMLEMKEELVFDRRRSRMLRDIQSITLMVPQGTSKETEMGDLKLATFKYRDLYEYFKEVYEASQEKGTIEEVKAFWYNPENPRRHMSLADALELRLFSSRIIKVANPEDNNLVSLIEKEFGQDDPKKAQKILYLSQKLTYDLMELEHNLWEY